MHLLLVLACASPSIELDETKPEGTDDPATDTAADADTDTDADTDADADSDTDADTDSDTETTEPVAVTYTGEVAGGLNTELFYSECAGEVEVTVDVDGAASGVANCYVEQLRTDLIGEIVGAVDGPAFEAVWTLDVMGQAYPVTLTGRVRAGESFQAEFADANDYFSFEGTMEGVP